MLVTADWIVPIDAPPIQGGGIVIRGGKIVAIGPADSVAHANGTTSTHHFEGCTIIPGLVNAHTHLALTSLGGLIPSQPFPEWLSHIPAAFNALSEDDVAASTALGATRTITAGVTVVGDIAYGPESVAIAADTGLAGRFYWEVLGIDVHDLPQTLYDMEYPSDPGRGFSNRVRCGVSPHAPYSSGPDLLRGTHTIARAQGAGYAIHVAESDAEGELLASGTGALAGVASRLAHGFRPPGSTAVSYLNELGVLDDAVAVHCTQASRPDIAMLVRHARGVVLCPRSNEYLMNGMPPAWAFAAAGMALALGTDSLASNTDLDLFEEARHLARREPRFSAERLIRMMTIEGAGVLGMADEFGSLAPGKQADLAVYRVVGDDPYRALLDGAGRHTTEAVLSAGVWRVLSGGPTMGISLIERAARLATERARLALSDYGIDF